MLKTLKLVETGAGRSERHGIARARMFAAYRTASARVPRSIIGDASLDPSQSMEWPRRSGARLSLWPAMVPAVVCRDCLYLYPREQSTAAPETRRQLQSGVDVRCFRIVEIFNTTEAANKFNAMFNTRKRRDRRADSFERRSGQARHRRARHGILHVVHPAQVDRLAIHKWPAVPADSPAVNETPYGTDCVALNQYTSARVRPRRSRQAESS